MMCHIFSKNYWSAVVILTLLLLLLFFLNTCVENGHLLLINYFSHQFASNELLTTSWNPSSLLAEEDLTSTSQQYKAYLYC